METRPKSKVFMVAEIMAATMAMMGSSTREVRAGLFPSAELSTAHLPRNASSPVRRSQKKQRIRRRQVSAKVRARRWGK